MQCSRLIFLRYKIFFCRAGRDIGYDILNDPGIPFDRNSGYNGKSHPGSLFELLSAGSSGSADVRQSEL